MVSARLIAACGDAHASKAPARSLWHRICRVYSCIEVASRSRIGSGWIFIMGEKYFTIPWNALTVNTDSEGELDYLVLGVDKDSL